MSTTNVISVQVLKAMSRPEGVSSHIWNQARAALSHIDSFHQPFGNKVVSFELFEAWLRAFLADRQQNGKKDFPIQTINNYIHALKTVSQEKFKHHGHDAEQIRIREEWDSLSIQMLKSIDRPGMQKLFRNAWPRFRTWMAEKRISPSNFDMASWKEFRAWLINRFRRKATGENYAQGLKVGLTALGYTICQKRSTRTFPDQIENEIEAIKRFSTSLKSRGRIGTLAEESLKTAQISPETFVNYEQTLRLYLDFHRDYLLESNDMSSLLSREHIENQILSWLSDHDYSEETFTNRLSQLIQFAKYMWELKLGIFSALGAEEMRAHLDLIAPLYEYRKRFRGSTVRAKREKTPLPSYSAVYLKMMESISMEIRSVQRARRSLDSSPASPFKEKKIKDLSIKYGNCIAGIMMLLFASRPKDLFGTILAIGSVDPVSGENIPASIKKSETGTWILKYTPSKTNRLDKVHYKNMARPEVYWTWPPEFNDLLEDYLMRYRPNIHPGSPLLLPGDSDLMKNTGKGYLGNRVSTGAAICRRISEKFYGKQLSENDFRAMLQTFLVVIGREHREAYIVGHAAKSALSKTARTSYLVLNDEVIEENAQDYWPRFFSKLNDYNARTLVRHRTG